MGSRPFITLESRGREVIVTREGHSEVTQGDPFEMLDHLLKRYRLDADDLPVPFATGAVGYLGYDLCHFIERLPRKAIADVGLPECWFAFYDTVLAFDHLEDMYYIVANGFPEETESLRRSMARDSILRLKSHLKNSGCQPQVLNRDNRQSIALSSNFTHDGYLAAVARARDYICAGDIYQVNLSQRFNADLTIPPYELYKRLRTINPAPFAAYLDLGAQAVLSASPERFLKLTGDRVETRPIKGTRPRGLTTTQDAAFARELLTSVKDHAENIMIVDLERNDFGRVCRIGSVKVTELAALETFPTVFHLVSTVTGQLWPDCTGVDLLRATFPGGSITGAPKVRAMEIIDELEPTRRNAYCGALGYLGFNGDLDLSIVIRTFLIDGSKVYYQVGGGIVYDSEPEAEYQETLTKGQAMKRALGLR
jgi:para-aminobenzoate synthetase component 1